MRLRRRGEGAIRHSGGAPSARRGALRPRRTDDGQAPYRGREPALSAQSRELVMQAGKMRNRVTLQEKSTGRDAIGGEIVTWVDLSTVWAELDPWHLRDRLVQR